MIAVLLWDKEISMISVIGFIIFFTGLFAYSYLTFKARRRQNKSSDRTDEGGKETTKGS